MFGTRRDSDRPLDAVLHRRPAHLARQRHLGEHPQRKVRFGPSGPGHLGPERRALTTGAPNGLEGR